MKNKIATISELQAIPYKDEGQPLIELKGIVSNYCRTDSGLHTLLVRQSVADRFKKLSNN